MKKKYSLTLSLSLSVSSLEIDRFSEQHPDASTGSARSDVWGTIFKSPLCPPPYRLDCYIGEIRALNVTYIHRYIISPGSVYYGCEWHGMPWDDVYISSCSYLITSQRQKKNFLSLSQKCISPSWTNCVSLKCRGKSIFCELRPMLFQLSKRASPRHFAQTTCAAWIYATENKYIVLAMLQRATIFRFVLFLK